MFCHSYDILCPGSVFNDGTQYFCYVYVVILSPGTKYYVTFDDIVSEDTGISFYFLLIIIQINGCDITKLSNPAAVTLIRNQPTKVTITILRPVATSEVPTKPPRTDHVVRDAGADTQSTGAVEPNEDKSVKREAVAENLISGQRQDAEYSQSGNADSQQQIEVCYIWKLLHWPKKIEL